MKKLVFILFLFYSLLSFSQEKVLVIDSETKKPIAFATVIFGNGFGGYTNENGEFTFDKKQDFTVSFIGYTTLNVPESDFKNIIELQNDPVEIKEVTISNRRRKPKIIEQDMYWEDATWLNSFTPFIGTEVAVFIPNKKKKNVVLSKLTIPIANDPLRTFDEKRKEHFKTREEFPYTIIRIRFYENQNNQPKKLLYQDEIVTTLHKSEYTSKEINLEEYDINIPKNGFFVGIEFLGYADSNETYVYKPNYYELERNGNKIRVSTSSDICIPIDRKSKKQNTFIRNSDWQENRDKKKWEPFTQEAFLKSRSEQERQKNQKLTNIGLGYELKTYE